MRTVIIVGAMFIADAINPEMNISDNAIRFVGGLVIASMAMDLTDFFKKNKSQFLCYTLLYSRFNVLQRLV